MTAMADQPRSTGRHNVSRETNFNGSVAFQAHFRVGPETIAKLKLYAELLTQWQKTINLIAPRTLDQVWHRHFADSAQLIDHLPPLTKTLVDIGSGAGFPGLVIAIMVNDAGFRARHPHPIKVTLVESDQRKVAFLREVARQTGTVVDIVAARIESPATQSRVGLQDVISARALAPLSELISYPRAWIGPQTVCLFLKGRDAEREVEQAKQTAAFTAVLHPSLTDAEARVVVVSELQTQRS